jgi:hypothetical protein
MVPRQQGRSLAHAGQRRGYFGEQLIRRSGWTVQVWTSAGPMLHACCPAVASWLWPGQQCWQQSSICLQRMTGLRRRSRCAGHLAHVRGRRWLRGIARSIQPGGVRLDGRWARWRGLAWMRTMNECAGAPVRRLPREMPGRGIGMRPPGRPLLGGGTDERRVRMLAPPAPVGRHLAGGCREVDVAGR